MIYEDETQIDKADIDALHADVLALVARAETVLPRIAAVAATGGSIQVEERLARLANAYLCAAHDLMQQSHAVHAALIEDPRLIALRRRLRHYGQRP